MADKEIKELTPWQKHHAEFERKKAEVAEKEQQVSGKKLSESANAAPLKTTKNVTDTESEPVAERQQTPSLLVKFKSNFTNAKSISDVLVKMWFFLLIAAVIFIGSLYVVSPLSKIASFTPTGNAHETSEQIADATGIKTNDHVWQIIKSEKALSQKIVAAFPRVKSAQINWHFPNDFSAKITEFPESLYLKTGNDYYLVLSNGTILTDEKIDGTQLAERPILIDFTEKEVKAFVIAYETLKPEIKAQITNVTKVPTKVSKDFIALDMKDGNQVRVPLMQLAEKLPYYTSIAENITESSVIDMEAGAYAKSKAAYQQDLDDEAADEKSKKDSENTVDETAQESILEDEQEMYSD
ncbi:cell division protein DivIB [Lactococcus hodotermopsidis]|uniref:Cell division protein DivIB n=1 Tax=Pseudolactococcus hodotermopsidis TaxID=2709157 RepID=A0A6A0BAC6_9LACT|nr:cell division protein FtsQ/DivIB [Lactococcus hodotermopsidis]GFH42410.1 cell division protein DivIB [Lactococcus hodotermopsidis]